MPDSIFFGEIQHDTIENFIHNSTNSSEESKSIFVVTRKFYFLLNTHLN